MKRSPIYAHFSETISGVSTIRAYNRAEAFVEKSDVLIDGNNMAYYPSVVSNRFDYSNKQTFGIITGFSGYLLLYR